MDIMLVDAESGESVTITGLGSGQDSGDKAVMKAQTAAIKYAYLLSMAISTGDDPEADGRTDEAITINSTVKKRATKDTKTQENRVACFDCGAEISDKVRLYSKQKLEMHYV